MTLKPLLTCLFALLFPMSGQASDLAGIFASPQSEARPWVLWYWIQASVSREGITADLEAMAEAGIAGAYLMPIKGPADPPLMEPVNQLSPEWWEMVRWSFAEADRLGLKLALHACDGFAVAGGPWIRPEQSMQKVVWSRMEVAGGGTVEVQIPQPETNEGYYREIALYAIPARADSGVSTREITPVVSTSDGQDAAFLTREEDSERLAMREPGWIQYSFESPFTARSVRVIPQGTNFWSKRLRIEASDDGEHFFLVRQLEPPRHGWQDGEAALTWSIPQTRARYFRFIYDPEGTEPGSEDLESAKWRPALKICGITLSADPVIHQFEGKSGLVWRISRATPVRDLPEYLCPQLDEVMDISQHMDSTGHLNWEAPAGRWTLLRMGHTSTGKTNYIGGAGKGLEVDKFNPEAVALQYDRWFGEAIRQVGPELAGRVLAGFHLDSWECGSQNWSPLFRPAFIGQHGYDPVRWLPALAGIPVGGRKRSEAFLHDVRETIAELLNRNFFGTLERLSSRDGVLFGAEATAPTMVGDGMLHHGVVDIPIGEFWLRSPTHDKPNDMLDAISGGHVYGKPVIQAEAFTEVRMAWDEHPGNIKALGDYNLALGINRFIFHVFTHNPWTDRAPGMTLDGVGLYFQRDQTWWKPGKAWLDYLARCQAFLQAGHPKAAIAVFTGEEIPRRAILPDRLVDMLPGLIGPERIRRHAERLENSGQPMREMPRGVDSAANMEKPVDWIDPLHGYAYDSINRDALLRLARVEDGRIVLPGGAAYDLLVVPGKRRMAPDGNRLSPEILARLLELVEQGAMVLLVDKPETRESISGMDSGDQYIAALWGPEPVQGIGLGRVIRGPWEQESLGGLGILPAVRIAAAGGQPVHNVAWCERVLDNTRLFFFSNQIDRSQSLQLTFPGGEQVPVIWDPVTGEHGRIPEWSYAEGSTRVRLELEAFQSVFITLEPAVHPAPKGTAAPSMEILFPLRETWLVSFSPESGGPADMVAFDRLADWSQHDDPRIRHYSGTACYETVFQFPSALVSRGSRYFLDLGEVANLAEVIVNGIPCGVAWTAPMRVDVTNALRFGSNALEIRVTNTWANRLLGDHQLPESERLTWTTAPFRLIEGSPLLPAGLLGPVMLLQSTSTH